MGAQCENRRAAVFVDVVGHLRLIYCVDSRSGVDDLRTRDLLTYMLQFIAIDEDNDKPGMS